MIMLPDVERSNPGSIASAPWDGIQILAPTALEYWAIRCVLPTAKVVRAGVRLSHHRETTGGRAITCGLAGGLSSDLSPGTVVIPNQVGLPGGRIVSCEPSLVRALTEGARTLGFEPDAGPMVTTETLVTGTDREYWSSRGFTTADMETGILAVRGLRVATVRVVLDTPVRDIAEGWLRPEQVILQPRLWGEFWWLCHAAPAYALRAARVLRAALALPAGE